MEQILKDHNLKVTKNRLLILEYIKRKKYIILNELLELNIDKSTIYRIIDIFVNNNIIDIINFENEKKYTLSQKHFHILKCIVCHNQTEIDMCPFDKSNYKDFVITKHSVIIEGICKKCQQKN